MAFGRDFLGSHDTDELLALVGRRVDGFPAFEAVGKSALPACFGGGETAACDDLLVGRGMFYLTETGRLCLDCTSGSYQMLLGYGDPDLTAAMAEAAEAGIIWDNHHNIPQAPVKALARRLAAIGGDGLDRVHLGCSTGSVACAAALKMQLTCYERRAGAEAETPAVIVLKGNYHGTDMMAQALRGMWGRYVRNLEVIGVEPNDEAGLSEAFQRCGKRVAGFWAEPIMMNREVVVIEPAYLRRARELCDQTGALMCIDEIQTGFWQPEVFSCRAMGIKPDLLIAGKGMTAGFHPQAAVLHTSDCDVLATYDALSTNGSAALPCYVALCVLDRIEADAERFAAVGDRYEAGMTALAGEFGDRLADARGVRHMMGLKFREVDDALDVHRRAVEAGLWVRAHAYHAGHSTVLTKLGLIADEAIVDFILAKLRELLSDRSRK
jgi:adenosylmethionine-8-amino-7-oxononanoate aminotransferase